ncbi:dipeptidase PepE [Pleionea sediminis]|uniref:dipeptidase PepE n=1 Tax=Pleionea sediminis TaxID=2569479 RepID=UPI001185515D|nr:dipeptidase PepE [Pleionea sediminis]
MRNLLLLSSSKEGNSQYLVHALPLIDQFLIKTDPEATKNALFIPFAGVSVSFDQYLKRVQGALESTELRISSIHQAENPEHAIKTASCIIVGGGNTFHLLHQLYQFDLIGLIRDKVMSGTPYIGWSAGSNIAAPSIRTTNDMPIVQPPSFNALRLVPFQINPHYIDQHPPGFHGETREERLVEYMTVNPNSTVIGLPEGTGIEVNQERLHLVGGKSAYRFKAGKKETISADDHLNYLLSES